MYSSKPNRPAVSGASRALCQSVMKTSCSGSMVRTVARSSVEKWPESGATMSTRGCDASMSFLKWSSVPNGVDAAASSRTSTSRLPTVTEPMPKGGRV